MPRTLVSSDLLVIVHLPVSLVLDFKPVVDVKEEEKSRFEY